MLLARWMTFKRCLWILVLILVIIGFNWLDMTVPSLHISSFLSGCWLFCSVFIQSAWTYFTLSLNSYSGIFFLRTTLPSSPSIQRLLMEDQGPWWSSHLWLTCLKGTPRMRPATLWKPWSSAISNHFVMSQSGLQFRTALSQSIGSEN